ncbi:helix-turn-helix domain-containing protein [Escherichia coli]|nr:helix-turn-helix domain-containing protein [Escherichia coli]
MSTKLTGYVWDGCAASGMKLSSVAIMARLADFSNDEGVCWPSIETIARQIGAGMSTVRTAIARLDPYFKASYDNVDYSQIPAGFRG